MADEHLRLSIRMMRHYDPDKDTHPGLSMRDKALMLAMSDDREDATTAQKVVDALAFLKRRIH